MSPDTLRLKFIEKYKRSGNFEKEDMGEGISQRASGLVLSFQKSRRWGLHGGITRTQRHRTGAQKQTHGNGAFLSARDRAPERQQTTPPGAPGRPATPSPSEKMEIRSPPDTAHGNQFQSGHRPEAGVKPYFQIFRRTRGRIPLCY